MENDKKIVTQIPLSSLWTDIENINATRQKQLTAKEIQEILKTKPVEFVVANIGEKLLWITEDNTFEFWKTE